MMNAAWGVRSGISVDTHVHRSPPCCTLYCTVGCTTGSLGGWAGRRVVANPSRPGDSWRCGVSSSEVLSVLSTGLAAPGTVGRGQPASHRVRTAGRTYSFVFLKKLDRLLSSMRIRESVSFQVCKPVKPLCGDCTAQRSAPQAALIWTGSSAGQRQH